MPVTKRKYENFGSSAYSILYCVFLKYGYKIAFLPLIHDSTLTLETPYYRITVLPYCIYPLALLTVNCNTFVDPTIAPLLSSITLLYHAWWLFGRAFITLSIVGSLQCWLRPVAGNDRCQ